MSKEKWNQLLEVSRFQRPATAWIKASRVLNIYTGEIQEANIAIFEDRIAYVGDKEPCIDEDTEIIDAGNYTLVPGYIEPHTHPFQVYNPVSLAEFALQKGTTTLVHDNHYFFLQLNQEKMEALFEKLASIPVKNFWSGRLDPQTNDPRMKAKFDLERVKRTLEHPLVIQAGELTAWKDLLDGDVEIRDRVYLARSMGKRLEAHNPGASPETLNSIAVAGATCCHESITAEDVMTRLRLGLYATLRYSSIRPDLPHLVQELLKQGLADWRRVLITTDGSAPFFLEKGFTDYLIQLAMESGLPPVEAYRLATLNPAVYYGLDQDIGGIAPGRLADILFLEDLHQPTPVHVMANGRMQVHNGELMQSLDLDWTPFEQDNRLLPEWEAQPDWFQVRTEEKFPVAHMKNAAILLQRNESFPQTNQIADLQDFPNYLYIALLDVYGKWITTGIIQGFGEFDALASSYSISQDYIVMGKDPQQMAEAVNRVKKMGGGITLFENNEPIYDLRLPILNGMSREKMPVLIEQTAELVRLLRERGYQHGDPIYSLLFMSATHLPAIRFTAQGIYSVKRDEILIPSSRLETMC